MKNLIMFFVLVMVMVFSNYEVSYSQEEDGLFLFLVGTEGNEKAIMYLHIEGESAYGSYYTESQSIIGQAAEEDDDDGGFSGSFDGKNLKLSYRDDNYRERTITGILSLEGSRMDGSGVGIIFKGKHNSKNVNLSLAKTPVNLAVIKGEYWEKRFIFNVRTLDNLSYYGRYKSIIYLDENIIVINEQWMNGSSYNNSSGVYSINTGNEIGIRDFISNLNDRNLSALLKGKGSKYSNLNDFENFMVTPNGIIFYSDYNSASFDDRSGEYEVEGECIYIEFTFEELKPFIKRGSVLDYLFN